jgi:hypothetical protein
VRNGGKAQSGHYDLDTTYRRFSFGGADEITVLLELWKAKSKRKTLAKFGRGLKNVVVF